MKKILLILLLTPAITRAQNPVLPALCASVQAQGCTIPATNVTGNLPSSQVSGTIPYTQISGINGSSITTITGNWSGTVGNATVFGNCTAIGGCTYTLPAASAQSGQIVTITKVDTSSQPLRVIGAGSDLIASSNSVVMYAQGQTMTVQNDGSSNWWPIGKLPSNTAYLGYIAEPVSAAAVATSSDVIYCPFTVTEPVSVVGMRVDVGASGGNGKAAWDLGVMDQWGKKLASTTPKTIPGTGLTTSTFSASVPLQPGVYYGAILLTFGTAGAAVPTTLTRFGTGGSNLGCAVEAGSATAIPAVGNLTGVGSGVRQFAFEILTAGGPSL